MSSKPTLKIDWATAKAATFAVKNWHYSGAMPAGKLVKVGAWEDERFVGVVLFGLGATPNINVPLKVSKTEACELVRVALRGHASPVSRIVAIALKYLRRKCPGIRVVVSFADPMQNHHGGIYQAGNWTYLGPMPPQCKYRINGVMVHPKTCHARYGTGGQSVPWLRKNIDPKAERIMYPSKHKYVYAFERDLRAEFEKQKLPYPKRASEV